MKSFKASIVFLSTTIVLLTASSIAPASQDTKGPGKAASAASPATPAVERELIPGAERMTGAERDAYRRRMESATTPDEKARVRAEYAKDPIGPAPATTSVGDAARGAALHRGCFGCHGIERYVAPVTYAAASFLDSVLRASGLSDLPPAGPTRFKGRAKTMAELRSGVVRRNDLLNPKMNSQEVEDVIAYLNVTYYNFPQ